MEFILQLMADLFLPDEMGKQNNESVEKVTIEDSKIEVEEKSVESENIFSLMEFH